MDGGGDKAIAAVVDVARFQPVRAEIHGQQGIAICLFDLVPGEVFLAEIFIKIWVGQDDVIGESHHFPGAHFLLGVAPAPCVGKGRTLQSKLARAFRHERGEGSFRSGDPFGERDRRVIARHNHKAANQILDPNAAIGGGEHGGSARRRAAVAPGRFADHELIVELQMPQRDFMEYDFGGHDFDRGRRNDESVGILFEQDALTSRIDQNRMGSVGLKRLGEGRGDAPGRSWEENRQHDRWDRIREPETEKARDRSNCLHCAPPPGRTSPGNP